MCLVEKIVVRSSQAAAVMVCVISGGVTKISSASRKSGSRGRNVAARGEDRASHLRPREGRQNSQNQQASAQVPHPRQDRRLVPKQQTLSVSSLNSRKKSVTRPSPNCPCKNGKIVFQAKMKNGS